MGSHDAGAGPLALGMVLALLLPTPALSSLELPRTLALDDCDGLAREHPKELNAWWCYCAVAQRTGQWSDAIDRLRAAHAREPSDPFAGFYLAVAQQRTGGAWDEALLRQAAEGFAREHEPTGEIRARHALAYLLTSSLRGAEAGRQHALALQAAKASGQPRLVTFAQIQWARTAWSSQNYGLAWELFREAESAVFPDGSVELQRDVLNGLGNVCSVTGRLREALDYYQRQADLMHRAGDLSEESVARYNISLMASRLREAGEMTQTRFRELQAEALDTALRAGNSAIEGSVRLGMAQDRTLDMGERLAEVEKALALSRRAGHFDDTCFALRLKALYLSRLDPAHLEEPMLLIAEALRMARARGNLHHAARALHVRSMVEWQNGLTGQAIADSLAALDSIERIRDLQRDEEIRSRVFAEWTYVYYRTSGWTLKTAGHDPSPAEMNTAFLVSERLRARTLLDVLDAAGAVAGGGPEGPDARQRADLLSEIAGTRRRLNDPGLSTDGRKKALDELGRLESLEETLREQLARSTPSFAALRDPSIPSIDQVQGALDDDQALLAFQLWQTDIERGFPLGSGGSWVFVLTRGTARVLPLADRRVFDASVPAFIGLLQRRDGAEARAAASLYRDLLGPAIEGFPPGIRKLIIVPDAVLHQLPFGALRDRSDGEPIASRFEISVSPSAALWLRWQEPGSTNGAIPALALADPATGPGEGTSGILRSATLAGAPQLGPLPLARREARALVRNLGGGSRLLIGGDATERFLKTTNLGSYRVLHLAAHAITDETHPDRSAVILAPGDPEEDGLLQIREIVNLDLRGQLVLLSACRSASGALLEGEGILGLARGFFQAGARAVIGSLWPLRDDDAAELIESVSRHLGRGLSAQAALTAAQREMIGAHAPVTAWAGFVLIGDGDLVALPGGRRDGATLNAAALAAGTALFVVLFIWLLSRSRRRRQA